MKKKTAGHLALFGANTMWGIMSPISKLLLAAGVLSATALADLRLVCGAALFWLLSLFVKTDKIDKGDYIRLFAVAFFSAALNQILFVNGVALTSPVDASIATSTLPIWTMLLAAFFLKEPLSAGKISGVLLGLSGATILILAGTTKGAGNESNIWGDLLCLGSQLSYAIYLVFFQDIIKKYSPLTLMKWKYLFAALMLLPFSFGALSGISWPEFTSGNWISLAYILLFGTFLSYLIVPIGQKTLRPTVVAMYNYLQPICATIFAIFYGQDRLTPMKILAIALIFTGVMLVNKSREKAADVK